MESQEDFAQRVNARRRLRGDRLAKACETMEDRYGATFLFCGPEDAARTVCELLGVDHGGC